MKDGEPKRKRRSGVVIGRPSQRRPWTGGPGISVEDEQLESRLRGAIGEKSGMILKTILGCHSGNP